jgi:hypothetical protein
LDATLVNLLAWSGLSPRPSGDGSPFVPDAYFTPEPVDRPGLRLRDDPTLGLAERQRERVGSLALHPDLTESARDVLVSVADRGDARPEVLADRVGWSARTVRRAVDRLPGYLTLRDGAVSFVTPTVRQAVQRALAGGARDGRMADTTDEAGPTTDAPSEPRADADGTRATAATDGGRDGGPTEWVAYAATHGVSVVEGDLSLMLRYPEPPDRATKHEGLRAWKASGRDPETFRKAALLAPATDDEVGTKRRLRPSSGHIRRPFEYPEPRVPDDARVVDVLTLREPPDGLRSGRR